jgi:hypothetical protein
MTHTLSRRALHSVLFVGLFAAAWGQPWTLLAQSSGSARNARISADEMKAWLTYLASDQLQGRQVFTEGYGLAAQYIASHLGTWGVKPLGPDGTYLQPVRLTGYRVTRNSSVTVEANGQRTTFTHGEHVTFPANAGGKQTLTFDGAEFVGYGQPGDYKGREVKGKLVVTVPNLAPPAQGAGRGGAPAAPATAPATAGPAPSGGATAGSPAAVAPAAPAGRGGNAGAIAAGAAAAVGLTPPAAAQTPAEEALAQAQQALAQATAAVAQAQQAARGGRGGGRAQGQGGARGAQAPPDVTSAQRVDATLPPQFTGDDTFFNALFAGSGVAFADLKAKAEKGEALAPVSLRAKVTVEIGHTYEPITQQLTHNVVGLVEGSDPQLMDTYVVIGAHLDHVGYSQTGAGRGGSNDGCRRRSPAAQDAVTAAGRLVQRPGRGGAPGARGAGAAGAGAPALPFDQRDGISNGADDNGSGSTALMAIAKAFATGPKPKRSIVFVWHTGEEAGLYGSRYNADFPVVPIDRTQAYLNMDMVGRDDCNNIEGDYTNTVFVVGADRISTDLHNVIVRTNGAMSAPLTLDYELNDANDPENVYTRSDHYSYALKGIPIAFFTTGLHPDYHRVSDTADKILFPKLARIAQLVYQTGFSIANAERVLQRDNKGARTGYGSKAEVLAK